MIHIRKYVNKTFSSNSYLIREDGTRDCILVDCGDNPRLIEDIVVAELIPVSVFLTHTHFDHIIGLNEFVSVFPNVKVFTNEFGASALISNKQNLSKYHQDPFEFRYSSTILTITSSCNSIIISSFNIKIEHVPGHNPSCLAYFIDKYLFSGDSFIPGLNVVTNLPNADKKMALDNYKKLRNQSKKFIICPGHGEFVTGSLF